MTRQWSKCLLRPRSSGVVATLAGIVPASFLLAQFGVEAVSGDLGRATWAVLGLGLVTGVPLLWVAMRRSPEKENP